MLRALCLVMLTLLCSCATVINGTSQRVSITSAPSNAQVYVDDEFRGNTPLKTRLSRRDSHVVKVTYSGYHPYQTILIPRRSALFFVDAVGAGLVTFIGIAGTAEPGNTWAGYTGPALGAAIIAMDNLTGGAFRLDPHTVHAPLLPLTT